MFADGGEVSSLEMEITELSSSLSVSVSVTISTFLEGSFDLLFFFFDALRIFLLSNVSSLLFNSSNFSLIFSSIIFSKSLAFVASEMERADCAELFPVSPRAFVELADVFD